MKAAFNNFCTYDYIEENEQLDFLSILYHNARGAKIRVTLDPKKTNYSQYSNFNYKALTTTDTKNNVYTTVNTFNKYKRVQENVAFYTGIYIDLDCHEIKGYTVEQSLKITLSHLESCYRRGTLLRPTMLVCTGRGYAVYYILDNTIANTEKAKNSINYYRLIKNRLFQKYDRILKEKPGAASVDPSVKEDARITRLPGTINHNNGSWCHLIDINTNDEGEATYYSLNSIAEGNHLFSTAETTSKKKKPLKYIYISDFKYPVLMLRLEKLKALQNMRLQNKTEAYRENTCFVFYNTAMQLFGKEVATLEVKAFNKNFLNPLEEHEIVSAINSVNRIEPTDSKNERTGGYHLTDKWIIERLGITDTENKQIGFGYNTKKIERAKTKQENTERRESRNNQIILYVKENPDKTYKEISELFNISLATLKRILANAQVGRYKTKGSLINNEKAHKMPTILLGGLEASQSPANTEAPFGILRSSLAAFNQAVLTCMENRPIRGQLVLDFIGDSAPSSG